MFRLVVADDEKLIIKGLEKLVNWDSLGIKIVGEYNDGYSALEGIIALRPDIALLDISMPNMSGIEVLETIQEQGIGTNVIFISGFQDFEYVKAALRHGAKDYLLKPVVRSELLRAIEKCIPKKFNEEKKENAIPDYSSILADKNGLIVATVNPIVPDDSTPLSRLMKFSLKEAVSGYVREFDGVFSEENGTSFIVFPFSDAERAEKRLIEISEKIKTVHGGAIAFVLSPPFTLLSEIKEEVDIAAAFSEFAFFSSYLSLPVLRLSDLPETISPIEMMTLRDNGFQAAISHDRDAFMKNAARIAAVIPSSSSFRKSEAAFSFCNVLFNLSGRLKTAMINLPEPTLEKIMNSLIATKDYSEMATIFFSEYEKLYDAVDRITGGSDEREFITALDYIEKHYMEPIGLKTLSGVVNMNAYYFSSYFKKNTGVNFKDYLRTVRMNHAMEMIVSTDMSISAIARAVGVMDTRTFSELFQKTFGEKPSVCMKRTRGKGGDDE